MEKNTLYRYRKGKTGALRLSTRRRKQRAEFLKRWRMERKKLVESLLESAKDDTCVGNEEITDPLCTISEVCGNNNHPEPQEQNYDTPSENFLQSSAVQQSKIQRWDYDCTFPEASNGGRPDDSSASSPSTSIRQEVCLELKKEIDLEESSSLKDRENDDSFSGVTNGGTLNDSPPSTSNNQEVQQEFKPEIDQEDNSSSNVLWFGPKIPNEVTIEELKVDPIMYEETQNDYSTQSDDGHEEMEVPIDPLDVKVKVEIIEEEDGEDDCYRNCEDYDDEEQGDDGEQFEYDEVAARKRRTPDLPQEYSSSPVKRCRKVMPLRDKVDILDKLRDGESAMSIARQYGVNESTIRTIRRGEENIRASVKAGIYADYLYVSKRDRKMEKMEKLLSLWVEDETQKRACFDISKVRRKALSIYDYLKEDEGSSFQASRGWLQRFKKRYHLENVKLDSGEAAVDYVAAESFPDRFLQLVENYHPEQVFNADEVSLHWKKMPNRTFVSKEEKTASGFKAGKDRVTVLLCGNACGDFKCKPLFVFRAETPRALKHKKKELLPVVWRSNSNAWVTAKMFEEWFTNSFIREVEDYLNSKGLAFKILLVLDGAPCHPRSLENLHPNVQVVFLPLCTATILQPMNLGIVSHFKSSYYHKCFTGVASAIESNPAIGIREYWKRFDILKAIEFVRESWDEVDETTVNECWAKLWPDAVRDVKHFLHSEDKIGKILELSKRIGGEGFDDMTECDVIELLEARAEEMTPAELEAVSQCQEEEKSQCEEVAQETRRAEEKKESPLPKPEKPILTAAMLKVFLKQAENLKETVLKMDPVIERSLEFKKILDSALVPYIELRKQLMKSNQGHKKVDGVVLTEDDQS